MPLAGGKAKTPDRQRPGNDRRDPGGEYRHADLIDVDRQAVEEPKTMCDGYQCEQ